MNLLFKIFTNIIVKRALVTALVSASLGLFAWSTLKKEHVYYDQGFSDCQKKTIEAAIDKINTSRRLRSFNSASRELLAPCEHFNC